MPKTVRVCVPKSDCVPPAFRGGFQDHGSRGPSSNRSLYRDRDPFYDVSRRSAEPMSHLATTLADLGIKTGRPSKAELNQAANRFLELAIVEPTPTTDDSDISNPLTPNLFHDEEAEVDAENYYEETWDDLPSDSYLPTGADFGFRSDYENRTADNGLVEFEDLLQERENYKPTGSDRPMSGFHVFTP